MLMTTCVTASSYGCNATFKSKYFPENVNTHCKILFDDAAQADLNILNKFTKRSIIT